MFIANACAVLYSCEQNRYHPSQVSEGECRRIEARTHTYRVGRQHPRVRENRTDENDQLLVHAGSAFSQSVKGTPSDGEILSKHVRVDFLGLEFAQLVLHAPATRPHEDEEMRMSSARVLELPAARPRTTHQRSSRIRDVKDGESTKTSICTMLWMLWSLGFRAASTS